MSHIPRCLLTETVRAIRFQRIGEDSYQNKAISVWVLVRVVLVRLPSSFSSLKSAAYCTLVRACGGGGRSWSPLVITNGVTSPQLVTTWKSAPATHWKSPGAGLVIGV